MAVVNAGIIALTFTLNSTLVRLEDLAPTKRHPTAAPVTASSSTPSTINDDSGMKGGGCAADATAVSTFLGGGHASSSPSVLPVELHRPSIRRCHFTHHCLCHVGGRRRLDAPTCPLSASVITAAATIIAAIGQPSTALRPGYC